ncbi:TetR/AcrR family transcriptional regulator [Pontibacter harenae]|uniref:TetR/AcrR family transcriptional regulator n=1 Tax=Pontibacter harenae TaxID=2894083 RepID=UPI001E4C7684|nr:TetR/AcrR family transcriptional regulator [Pontibacter harenae]MCC9165432.1 TetR/AcrR family transcriptional regulator [Pontibacter harenae]
MTYLETILGDLLQLFHKEGIEAHSEEDIVSRLNMSASTYNELFKDRLDMVKQVVEHEVKLNEEEHRVNLAKANSPVEEIMYLLKDGIERTQKINFKYYIDLQQHYPEAWQLKLDHLDSYSYHQISEIINRGILQNQFRRDINIQLVTKIMLEQVRMVLNPAVFSPNRYSLPEVFRSTFLYYIRGICTDSGGRLAEEYFSKNDL